MTVRRQLSRLLLPEGSGRLRSDLGAFLKRRRQGRLDSEPFGTQAQIARRVGITRQTLSEIERGAAWPGPATLDVLLDILDLGWEHVAHSIASGGVNRDLICDASRQASRKTGHIGFASTTSELVCDWAVLLRVRTHWS
jgi:transcriptional regulator with XRE-family HTH domain